MTKEEFNTILESVKASDVHKTYSIEAGFIALTGRFGRKVIRIDDFLADAINILDQFNIPLCSKS